MDSKLTQKLLADQNELSNGKSQLCGYFDGPIRNIFLLAMAWALTLTTSTLLTTIGPLSVQSLGASDSLSAFAVGTFLLGAAVSSVPSARLFALYGRFIGFSVGCLCQCIGSILGAVAMKFRILELAYLGCFSIGLGQGLGQFYRFAAVEVSPPEYKSRAITYVLSGGILAAFLGPITANNTATLESPDYIGSYIIIALIGLLNLITVYFVQFPKPVKKLVVSQISSDESVNSLNFRDNNAQFIVNNLPQERSVLEIITQPLFIVSCAVATLAHTIMVMLMSDVTLAMTKDNFSLSSTSLVMELHFFSMFGPGFITGKLIGKYGSFQIAAAGAVVSLGAAVLFLLGTNAWNYFSGMILLGIGWNFSFSAGTVMLTDCYKVLSILICIYHNVIKFWMYSLTKLLNSKR